MRSANESKLPDSELSERRESGEVRVDDDEGLEAVHVALQAALDNKALEPMVLDVRGLCSYTNYLLLVSGRSDRHVESICNGVMKTMREQGHYPLGTEGKKSGQWALLDFGDCVTHVFYHATREHYDLEGLWIEAERVAIEVPEDARITRADDLDDGLDDGHDDRLD
ncbi:ribosome silencing factor [Haliangium ochraceum]|uniref:Ribosomal silencing factor RsfS n=1 Tax=Haliangium ochraceum (strain DSM 14365 / JCM 11303 / SMP-2) TaxID=502025 RepID=D0LK39_HALO1|nr:ribosome silencing factor [Haliangium ochraceum]ACY13073.1 iojap-like protein [Haliangium ochraceum DSM 14365]